MFSVVVIKNQVYTRQCSFLLNLSEAVFSKTEYKHVFMRIYIFIMYIFRSYQVFNDMRKVDHITADFIQLKCQSLYLCRLLQSCRLKWLTPSKRWSWQTCRSNSWVVWRSMQTSRMERLHHFLTALGCLREQDGCMYYSGGVKSEPFTLCCFDLSLLPFFRFILQSNGEIANQLLEKQKTADDKIKELEVS